MDILTPSPSLLSDSISSPITTVKMEDLEQQLINSAASPSASTPAADGKTPVKKRKSWGQQLPEPKTNLPPRKRAKTEDEKEQRRIERVKRNRLAAHNSRERKRLEVEKLDTEKQRLEDMVTSLREQMRQKDALLQAYQTMHGPIAGDTFKFAPALTVSDMDATSPSIDSQTTAMSLPSLSSAAPSIIDSPSTRSFSQPATPATPALPIEADVTQHSAVMLCPDLQCQSASMADEPELSDRPTTSGPSLSPSHCLSIILAVLHTLQSLSTWTSISSLITTSPTTSRSKRRSHPSSRMPAPLFSTTSLPQLLQILSFLSQRQTRSPFPHPLTLRLLLPALSSLSPMIPLSTLSSTSPPTLARRTLRLSMLRARSATGQARTLSKRDSEGITGRENEALVGVARWWERTQGQSISQERRTGGGLDSRRLEQQVKEQVRSFRRTRRRRREVIKLKGVGGVWD